MPKDPNERDQDVSRRRLLEKVTLVVGAATSVVAARSALARSVDVVMDSAGRVLIEGAPLPPQESSFQMAASTNDKCTNDYNCTGSSNKGCSNAKECVAPRRTAKPTAASKVNTQKMNAPSSSGGRSRK